MTWEWSALVGLALCALALAVVVTRQRARTRRELAAARAESAELRTRLDQLEQAAPVDQAPQVVLRDQREYLITRVGEAADPADQPEQASLERAVFADLLLKETVIRVGSLVHGLRRALAAETRNRIRFEMRREVKRARKQRRAEQRAAYREWQARQRDQRSDHDLRESA